MIFGKLVLMSALSAMISTSANAAIVTYQLNNVKFIEGGSASGSISFDTTKLPVADLFYTGQGFVSDFNVFVDAGAGFGNFGLPFDYSSFTYTAVNSVGDGSYETKRPEFAGLIIGFSNASRNLRFNLLSTPSDIGIAKNLKIDTGRPLNNQECIGFCGIRLITSGSLQLVDPAAVPEPATWAMMIAGMAAIGGTMRHRRRVQVSYG